MKSKSKEASEGVPLPLSEDALACVDEREAEAGFFFNCCFFAFIAVSNCAFFIAGVFASLDCFFAAMTRNVQVTASWALG